MNEIMAFGNSAVDIRKQLLKVARDMKRPSQELLQYYAMERYLYRLSASRYSDKFILKGGLLFTVWNMGDFRATQDIDFLSLSSNKPDHIEKVCRQVCGMSCNDGIVFEPETVSTSVIRPQNDYQGVQIKFKGRIDRSKVHMRVDVGFADAVHPNPITFSFPTILEMPAPTLLGYTQESVVAEKVDAMLQLGELNSRMKDFYDVWFLSHRVPFNMVTLGDALQATLDRRGTELALEPIVFQSAFGTNRLKTEQWINFCRQNRFSDVPEFDRLISRLKKFLLPVLDRVRLGNSLNISWVPEACSWTEKL
jgi:predicted nucleotidyltransferase component of viral defense system